MGRGSSRPNCARSRWATSGGTLALVASSENGSPGASARMPKRTMLIPTRTGIAIRRRRRTYLDMRDRRRARPPAIGPSRFAVPVGDTTERGIPAGQIEAAQLRGGRARPVAPVFRDDDDVVHHEIVHLDPHRRALHGVHLDLGGFPQPVVLLVAPPRRAA